METAVMLTAEELAVLIDIVAQRGDVDTLYPAAIESMFAKIQSAYEALDLEL